MTAQPVPQLSFEDWLAIERAAEDQRSEFVAGEVFAMTGATEQHNLIVANVVRELGIALKPKPCRVYPSDLKVRIEADNVGTYPDAMVICGERAFHDNRRDVVTNPTLIVEVLSESSEAYDRGDKFAHYRTLPSLQAYLLLSQERVQAELFVRQPDGTWKMLALDDPAERIPLAVFDAELNLGELYDKVEFAARPG
jgi:Uma2 family endonuclease